MDDVLLAKYEVLKEGLAALGSVAVAFSGGVDSTLLLHAAHEALGESALAVTVSSRVFPKRELEEAKAFCEAEGIRQLVVAFDELEVEGFAQNPPNRCYLCKRELFGKIGQVAQAEGMAAVAEGSNLDDEGDYRPGMQAVAELGIKSPLRHAALTKEEIRALSRHFGLPTWNKQSFACLASRFPYGDPITGEKLRMVDKGFHQVRVRIHGDLARIEVPSGEFSRFMDGDLRAEVHAAFKGLGFSYTTLDVRGYRTGSMNEALEK